MSLWGKWERTWLLVSQGIWQQWLWKWHWMCLPLRDSFCPCVWVGRGRARPDPKFVKTNTNIAAWITYFHLFVPREYLQIHQISVSILIILCFLDHVVKTAFILPFPSLFFFFFSPLRQQTLPTESL